MAPVNSQLKLLILKLVMLIYKKIFPRHSVPRWVDARIDARCLAMGKFSQKVSIDARVANHECATIELVVASQARSSDVSQQASHLQP
jgi:hypothetical protein